MAYLPFPPDTSVPEKNHQHKHSAAISYLESCGFVPTNWYEKFMHAAELDGIVREDMIQYYRSSSLGPMAELDARFERTKRGRLVDPELKRLNLNLISLVEKGEMIQAVDLFAHIKEAASRHKFRPKQAR